MIDIHPPQHAAITRREFFTHLGIVVLGILIAIGLEQTVELFHHAHQRHQFQEDLRAESEENLRIIGSDLAKEIPDLHWTISAVHAAQNAPVEGGMITVTLPPEAAHSATYSYSDATISTIPSHGVWTVAESTGVVNLLPPYQAQIYNRLDFEASESLRIDGLNDVQITECLAGLRSLNVRFAPGETLRLTPPQRDDLIRVVERYAQLQYWVDVRLSIWKGALEATLDHVKTTDAMIPYLEKYTAAIPQP